MHPEYGQGAHGPDVSDDPARAERRSAEDWLAELTSIFGLVQPKACFLARHLADRDVLQVTAVRGRNDARIAA